MDPEKFLDKMIVATGVWLVIWCSILASLGVLGIIFLYKLITHYM